MKILITIILFITFFSIGFTQNALLPAYPREIIGEGVNGDIAYFKGDNKPFTGILVNEKTQKRIGVFKNGYKNGIFTEYHINGQKKSECKYTNGLRDGKCTEWFTNGQKKSSYTYENGAILDGNYITYLENGKKETKSTYKNGRIIISGKYENDKFIVLLKLMVEFYPNGKKESEGYLKNGKKDGLWVEWYEDGLKKSIRNYKDGKEDKFMRGRQKKIKKNNKNEGNVGLKKSDHNMSGESGG